MVMKKLTFLAKQATQKHQIDMNLSLSITEIKNIFKNQIKQEWQKQWNKTNAKSNMKIIQPIVSFDMNTWNLDRHDETYSS